MCSNATHDTCASCRRVVRTHPGADVRDIATAGTVKAVRDPLRRHAVSRRHVPGQRHRNTRIGAVQFNRSPVVRAACRRRVYRRQRCWATLAFAGGGGGFFMRIQRIDATRHSGHVVGLSIAAT